MHSGTHISGFQKALLVWWMTGAISQAATLTIQETTPGSMSLNIGSDPLSYFYLKQSTDLKNFTPFSMVLGNQATTWPLSAEDVPIRFFRVTEISLFAPEDSDGDGIDDVYELRHPILNPLDSFDAGFDSGNNGMTFLQEYRARFSLGTAAPQIYSREVSFFNFSGAIDSAISREVSLFNFGMPLDSAISRELTLYNYGTPPYSAEAVSREISVFNGMPAPVPGIAEVHSREISVFNFSGPSAPIEAISREIALFNGDSAPTGNFREVHSREASLFNRGDQFTCIEAISREVSVINNAQ